MKLKFDADDGQPSTDHSAQQSEGRLRALVVDDEALIAMEIAELLRDAGFEIVGPAGSVDEAMALLAECECDLAVIDLRIDGVLAVDLIDALRERAIPCLYVTGLHPSDLPASVSVDQVLAKPFLGSQIVDRCRALSGAA
jgi:DNA-binding response OmpR family regulator